MLSTSVQSQTLMHGSVTDAITHEPLPAAIITDNNTVQNFTEIFSVLMPGDFRSFPKSKLENAVSWCATGEEKNN